MLRGAVGLDDSWPAAFAFSSLLRRGHVGDANVAERIAAHPEVRVSLYEQLAACHFSPCGTEERGPVATRMTLRLLLQWRIYRIKTGDVRHVVVRERR